MSGSLPLVPVPCSASPPICFSLLLVALPNLLSNPCLLATQIALAEPYPFAYLTFMKTASVSSSSLAAGAAPSAAAAAWLRSHFYKLLLLFVIVLILLQYAFSSIFEARQLEPLFAINASGSMRRGPVGGRHRSTASAEASPLWADGIWSAQGSTATATEVPASAAATSTLGTAATITTDSGLPPCPLIPPNLEGPVHVVKEAPPLAALEHMFPEVGVGGTWRPRTCRARHRVALVVPYRDRAAHLAVFLAHIHPFLQRQQLDYRIVIVEQAGSSAFNRAMLMNVGFIEALKLYDFDCFIFHDVDLLPEDDRNLYTCPEQPRHMSVAIDVFRYRLPYTDLFGGVSAMTKAQFQKVNGFSNMFWGWGGEDDDMSNRIKYHGFHISRYPANVARYKMLTHRKQKANPKRYEFLNTGRKRFKTDGLNSLRYVRCELDLHHMFTRVLVELASPS